MCFCRCFCFVGWVIFSLFLNHPRSCVILISYHRLYLCFYLCNYGGGGAVFLKVVAREISFDERVCALFWKVFLQSRVNSRLTRKHLVLVTSWWQSVSRPRVFQAFDSTPRGWFFLPSEELSFSFFLFFFFLYKKNSLEFEPNLLGWLSRHQKPKIVFFWLYMQNVSEWQL